VNFITLPEALPGSDLNLSFDKLVVAQAGNGNQQE